MPPSSVDKSVFSKLDNVGLVVSDLGAAEKYYGSIGIGPFVPLPERLSRGEGVMTSRCMVGGTGIELIQPAKGDSLWRDFLQANGEGLVHLGFATEDLAKGEEECRAAGLKPMYHTEFGEEGGVVGFDAREHGGTIFELTKYPAGELSSPEPSALPYSYIHHVGFVMKDVDAAVAYFEGLGFGPFGPLKLSGERIERTVYGKPAAYKLKNSGAHIGGTKVELEFLQPLENAPIQEEFLDKRGEGANHFGFKVGKVDAETEKLHQKGFDVIFTVRFNTGTVCKYIDTRGRGGMLVEFWQPPTGVPAPAPT
jgi:methylmalonyl-CoA/ethylmalonyl-CoA epimerase